MKLYFIILFLLFNVVAFAQNAIIRGKISTSDGKAAEFVNVQLNGTNKGTISNENGEYKIERIKAGTYKLKVSLVGLETKEQQVEVKAGQTLVVDFTLAESANQLQEVVVLSNTNKFSQKETESVARMPLKNLENSQVYSVVGKALMQEQVITERSDLYRNVPGAVPNFSAGGSQGMTTRGFATTVGMRNDMITSAVAPMNPIILERVEVLKGPSGTLFGGNRNATFGGVFNYVTKKPYDTFGGEVSFTAGSFGFSRVAADVNVPLNDEKTALFRLNTGWQSEDSFQDQGFARNFTIAPTITYQVSDRLKFTVDLDITRSSYTVSSLAIASLARVKARSFDELKLGYNRSLTNNNVDVQNRATNFGGQMEYKLSKSWKSETKFLFSEGAYEHFYWTTLSMLTDSTVMRTVRNQTPETFGNVHFQQNFIGDFSLGSLRNRMVLGVDYSVNYNALNRSAITYDTLNINKAVKDFNVYKINELSVKRGFTTTTFNSKSLGVYASNVINITPELMAMLSLRVDRYSTKGDYTLSTGTFKGGYEQTSLSPKMGLVYQPLKERVALFANYMNGFVNLAPVTQPDNSVLVLKPQYANQWETGVKLDLVKSKLNASISYYDISVTNATRTEVINGQSFTLQNGTQNSKGWDVELIANPISGLNIVVGYAKNENKYTKASEALNGKSLTASPKDVVNIWVSYYLTKGNFRGIGLGAGGNYVGESWFESTNVFVIPSYTLLNASIFYDQPKYRLALKANNLLDQQYWSSGGSPQKPFNILANLILKF
ncbi:TonB-dependent receptor [Arcicella sp. DC2W]|uniref:TonB-dependent receptor n=1 Tax=Arcicella gelida TaxID=2984195 RepID=A0ABU5S576_9BACT|nr:TonB-dependent receptor [Arcicella sp. DC2W]MEA5403596.1 TonB-dependent receptor [Arcicella sp. DC2W]